MAKLRVPEYAYRNNSGEKCDFIAKHQEEYYEKMSLNTNELIKVRQQNYGMAERKFGELLLN